MLLCFLFFALHSVYFSTCLMLFLLFSVYFLTRGPCFVWSFSFFLCCFRLLCLKPEKVHHSNHPATHPKNPVICWRWEPHGAMVSALSKKKPKKHREKHKKLTLKLDKTPKKVANIYRKTQKQTTTAHQNRSLSFEKQQRPKWSFFRSIKQRCPKRRPNGEPTEVKLGWVSGTKNEPLGWKRPAASYGAAGVFFFAIFLV